MTALWTILIASVYSRTRQLGELLDTLIPQLDTAGGQVRVLVDRDGGEAPIGVKRTRLVEAATSEYVCFVDDDDHVHPNYVALILKALEQDPDYVGFQVKYTINGVRQKPVVHSLVCGGWSETSAGYFRDVSHVNPIRREIAMAGLPFRDGFGEDCDWADRVRGDERLQREAFVEAELYHYDYSAATSLFAFGRCSPDDGRDVALPVSPHVSYMLVRPLIEADV